VEAIVKAEKDDTDSELELGRFGIFPYAEFKAGESDKVRRFSFPLPKDLAVGGPIKLKVYLSPIRGDGKGARMELSGAEVR
jgi:hypothetical protein